MLNIKQCKIGNPSSLINSSLGPPLALKRSAFCNFREMHNWTHCICPSIQAVHLCLVHQCVSTTGERIEDNCRGGFWTERAWKCLETSVCSNRWSPLVGTHKQRSLHINWMGWFSENHLYMEMLIGRYSFYIGMLGLPMPANITNRNLNILYLGFILIFVLSVISSNSPTQLLMKDKSILSSY